MRGSIKQVGDRFVAEGVFVISCGCGGVSANAQQYMAKAGVGDVPVYESSGNKTIKGYMEQVGLKIMITELKRPKHSILLNTNTGQFLNLLGAKKNPLLYENIAKVANGIV